MSVFNDPEFQEDAVREEIIGPILKHLGYSPSQSPKVVRSRKLSHPFVNIGSQKKNISIIPDYVLELNGKPVVVLDAKSPSVSLLKSSHAEQAYSYSIHPEIRAKMYALCNGKEWVIWDVDVFDPVAVITMEELIKDISILEKYLHPDAIAFPEKRGFLADFGLRMKKLGLADNTTQTFMFNPITNISKVEDGLYTINLCMSFGEEDLAISFDLSQNLYLELLELFPIGTRTYIIESLSRQPYSVFELEPVWVTLSGRFGNLTKGKFEDFIPVVITALKTAPPMT